VNIYVDSKMTDDARRNSLYHGSIFVYAPSPNSLKLCRLAKDMLEEAFAPLDPLRLQEILPVERCAEVLGVLKPKFIHHPKSKEYIQGILAERGCDLDKTYFDVPRLRSAFPGDYLKSGIAYAFHPHRDTWYSAPFSQVNWWMPIYPIDADNCMAIHPNYWNVPVKNGSSGYNYDRWNRESRQSAAAHIKTDTRAQPKPEEAMTLDPDVRLVCDVGGVYLFSAAQMHSSVPNTSSVTRYSIDFRTAHLDDVWTQCGAPNIDSACTGTTMRDYIRATDLTHVPEEAVALYFDSTEGDFIPSSFGELVGRGKPLDTQRTK
jgi:hypothetical protein